MERIANPALKELQVLTGTWDVEITLPAKPPNIVRAHASFEWLEDGAYLLMRMPVETDAPMRSTWLIGRDESIDIYSVLYFDSRGESRVYSMSLRGGQWKFWRDAPRFHQRFIGTISKDTNTIIAQWEKSNDGVKWEYDFDMSYRRAMPNRG
jgi:hypothetical protein